MRRLDIFQENHEGELIVGPGNTVQQTFTPTKNNLAGIRLPVSNPKLGSRDEYQLSIADDKNNIMRQETITGFNLGWQSTLRFDFVPIPDSTHKKFTLSFSYLGQNPADEDILSKINLRFWSNQKPDEKTEQIIEKTQKNYVHLPYTAINSYGEGEAMISNKLLPGDLAFETYYQISGTNYFKDVASDFTSHASQDLSFFFFYILLLFALIGLYISRLVKISSKMGDR